MIYVQQILLINVRMILTNWAFVNWSRLFYISFSIVNLLILCTYLKTSSKSIFLFSITFFKALCDSFERGEFYLFTDSNIKLFVAFSVNKFPSRKPYVFTVILTNSNADIVCDIIINLLS